MMDDKRNVNPIDLATQLLGITQDELGKRIGVSKAVISMWRFRGYVTQRYLAKACEVTGLPPHVLNHYVPKYSESGKQDGV